MRIRDLLAAESIELNGSAAGKQDVLNKMVDLMAKAEKSAMWKLTARGFCKRRRRNNRNWRGNCDPTLQVRCCESTGTGSYGSKGWCRV